VARTINLFLHRLRLSASPRLRLTLGGRTFPRNPWTSGGQDSHLSYRYSCQDSHFCEVQLHSHV